MLVKNIDNSTGNVQKLYKYRLNPYKKEYCNEERTYR